MIRPRGAAGYRGRPRSRSPIQHMRGPRRSPTPPNMRRNGGMPYTPRFQRGGPPGFRGRGRGFRGGGYSGGPPFRSRSPRDYSGSGNAPYRPRRDDAPPYMHRERERERSPFPRRPFERDYPPRYGRSPPRKFLDRGFIPDKRGSPPPYYNRDRPAPHFRRYSPNQGPRRNYEASPPNYHRSHRDPMGGYGPPRDGPGGRFDDRRRGPPPFERRRPAPMDREYDGMPPYKRSRGPPEFHEGDSPPSGGPKRAPPPFRDDRRGRSSEGSPARDTNRR